MTKAIALILFSLALEAGFLLQVAIPMRAAPAAPSVLAGEPSSANVAQAPAPAPRPGRS